MQLTPRSTQQTLSDGQCDNGTSEGMYSEVHSFWPVEFSNGGLEASQWCSDSVMFSLFPLSASVRTVDLDTLKFQANKHPHLATSPRPIGSFASATNSSTGQNPCNALYKANGFPQSVFVSALSHYVRNKCDCNRMSDKRLVFHLILPRLSQWVRDI